MKVFEIIAKIFKFILRADDVIEIRINNRVVGWVDRKGLLNLNVGSIVFPVKNLVIGDNCISITNNDLEIKTNSQTRAIFRSNGIVDFYGILNLNNETLNKYLNVITDWMELDGRDVNDGDFVVYRDTLTNTYYLFIYVNNSVGWRLVSTLT